MDYFKRNASALLFATALSAYTGYSVADESQPKDQQQSYKNSRDGYSLSVGLGYMNIESPTAIEEKFDGFKVVIDGRYQWKGLFVELANYRARSKNLPAAGYNFYSTEHWNLDVIAAAATARGEFNYYVDGQAKQISDETTRGFGFRAQGSWGNSVVQIVALPYFHEDFRSNSAVDYASLWVGHRWQIRNWSLNGLLGAVYKSSGLLDHQYGVTEGEADKIVWAYEPSSGIDYTAHIDLSYPVSKNILFQIYSRHTQYSDAVLDSPLTERARQWEGRPETEREFGVLLNYVF